MSGTPATVALRSAGIPFTEHAYTHDAAKRPGDNRTSAMKSVVTDPTEYDWEGESVIRRPFAETLSLIHI